MGVNLNYFIKKIEMHELHLYIKKHAMQWSIKKHHPVDFANTWDSL